MKYDLVFVPPGGGEADYQATINNATYIPRVGEYIILRNEAERGIRAFRVLYVTSGAVSLQEGEYQEEPPVVQAEFIRHSHQSEEHGASIKMYEARGKKVDAYPVSGY